MKESKGREGKPGKLKGGLSTKNAYKFYKSIVDEPVNYKFYKAVIANANKITAKWIIEGGEVRLSSGLGIQRIKKYDREYYKNSKPRFINWKLSKEYNTFVFFEDLYTYDWTWDYRKVPLKWKSVYRFKAARTNTRSIKRQIDSTNIDYFK